MLRTIVLLAVAMLLPLAAAAPVRLAPEVFLVKDDRGLVLLGADGEEKERLKPHTTIGSLSPDGQWLVFLEYNPSQSNLVIRSHSRPEQRTTFPAVWGTTGSGCGIVWASDSRRVLIQESAPGGRESRCRVYALASKKLTELVLPREYFVTDWSTDGTRFLASVYSEGKPPRIAWINSDGSGQMEYITSEEEVAYDARLSPDGQRILCIAGPKAPQRERSPVRLCVLDLTTKRRTPVDEPGETHRHCWSRDGSRIAYTWQRSLEKPAEVAERETLLITCNRDGSNRKTITSRKYKVPANASGRSGVVYFFEVLAWR